MTGRIRELKPDQMEEKGSFFTFFTEPVFYNVAFFDKNLTFDFVQFFALTSRYPAC